MTASNTKECFREIVGKRVTGVLFDALPNDVTHDLSRGTKTLVFEDGSGLTISDSGTFWRKHPEEVKRAIDVKHRELLALKRDIEDVLRDIEDVLIAAGENVA